MNAYYPAEAEVRKAAIAIIKAPQPAARVELLDAVRKLEDDIGPLNLMFIAELGQRLKHIDELDRLNA